MAWQPNQAQQATLAGIGGSQAPQAQPQQQQGLLPLVGAPASGANSGGQARPAVWQGSQEEWQNNPNALGGAPNGQGWRGLGFGTNFPRLAPNDWRLGSDPQAQQGLRDYMTTVENSLQGVKLPPEEEAAYRQFYAPPGKGVGMPAPQEPGMPAPGTVGHQVLPGGQGIPMGGNPFAGLPPASGGAPMFEDDPFRMVYTGGTPNFDETTGQFRTPLPMGAGKFPMTGRLPPDGMATIPGRRRGFGRFRRGGMGRFGPMGGLMGAPDLGQMNLPQPMPRVFQSGMGSPLEAPTDNPFMQEMGDMGARGQLIRMLMSQF